MGRTELHEVELETLGQLSHPLGSETGGGHDEDAVARPTKDQLLHVEPRHDRLAGARVVGQQETQAGLGQEPVVDRLELVGQRLDVRHRHGRHVVGERHLDPASLDAEPELDRVAVEAQVIDRLDDLDTGQLGLGQHPLAGSARPVEEELPEGAAGDRNERDDIVRAGEPHLRRRGEAVDLRRAVGDVLVGHRCRTPSLLSGHFPRTTCSRLGD